MSPILTGVIASGISGNLTPAALSGFVALNAYTFANSSLNTVTFSDIPQGYKHLMIVYQAWGTVNDGTRLRFNGDSGSTNYISVTGANGDGGSAATYVGSASSGATDVFNLLGGSYGSTQTSAAFGYINDYSKTNKLKTVTALNSNLNSSNEGNVQHGSGVWLGSTAAITSMTFVARTGNFNTNSTIALFGIN